MARMPNTIWKPVPNYRSGAIGNVVGVVLHHMVGSEASAYSRFSDPSSGASAHFGVCYDGTTYQYVDSDDASYHACMANYQGQIGVENESPAGDSPDVWAALRDEQVSACARILAWAHDTYGVPYRPADPQNRSGLGYHSMVPGDCSVAWGQTGCPGDAIVAQRDEIIRQAQGAAPLPPPEPEIDWAAIAAAAEEERRRQTMGAIGTYDMDGVLQCDYVDADGNLVHSYSSGGAWQHDVIAGPAATIGRCQTPSDPNAGVSWYKNAFGDDGRLDIYAQAADGSGAVHGYFHQRWGWSSDLIAR